MVSYPETTGRFLCQKQAFYVSVGLIQTNKLFTLKKDVTYYNRFYVVALVTLFWNTAGLTGINYKCPYFHFLSSQDRVN